MHNSVSVPSALAKFGENTQTDVRREEWAEPHRIFAATTRGLTSTTADWHLKVKNKKCNVALIKKLLHHSQHAKNQLNP